MNNLGSPKHAASNGTAQAIRGGEDSASNAVRCCSGKVTGTTTLQLPPARSMGSSASLLRATFSATAPGTTIRSPREIPGTWTAQGALDILAPPELPQLAHSVECTPGDDRFALAADVGRATRMTLIVALLRDFGAVQQMPSVVKRARCPAAGLAARPA